MFMPERSLLIRSIPGIYRLCLDILVVADLLKVRKFLHRAAHSTRSNWLRKPRTKAQRPHTDWIYSVLHETREFEEMRTRWARWTMSTWNPEGLQFDHVAMLIAPVLQIGHMLVAGITG